MEIKKQKIKSFTDLNSWQEAHKLLLLIYKNTKNFPKEELFCLASEMGTVAISISSNIAESFGRQRYKEKIQFYYLAQGSLTELKNQILTAKDIDYLDENALKEFIEQVNTAC